MTPFKLATVLLLLLLGAASALDPAWARPKVRRSPPAPAAVQDCNGTPIIMQGLPCPQAPARAVPDARADRPVRIPRGSSGYIPPVPAPGAPSLALPQPAPGPYIPPPIDSFSDRVMRCNQSFTFNAGVGNNPIGRDAYVRQCAN